MAVAIAATFDSANKGEKLTINLAFKQGSYLNTYPSWIYFAPEMDVAHEGITITEKMDDEVIAKLQNGEKVLLFPTFESVKIKVSPACSRLISGIMACSKVSANGQKNLFHPVRLEY